MNVRPKRLPRLWCARLGLLPFDVVLPSGATLPGAPCRRRWADAECSQRLETFRSPPRPDAERRHAEDGGRPFLLP